MPVNRDYINNLFLNYNKYRTRHMLGLDAEAETIRKTLIGACAGEGNYCLILCARIHAHINWRMYHRSVVGETVTGAVAAGVGYMAYFARSAASSAANFAKRRYYGEAPPEGTPPLTDTLLLVVNSRPQTPTLSGEPEAVVSVHSAGDYAPVGTTLSQQRVDVPPSYTTLTGHEFEEVPAADHLYAAPAPDVSGPVSLAETPIATTSIELFNLLIEHIHRDEFSPMFNPLLMSTEFIASIRGFVEHRRGDAEEVYSYLVLPTVMKNYLREEAQARIVRAGARTFTTRSPTAQPLPGTPIPTLHTRQTAASAAHVAAGAARRAAAAETSAKIAAERRMAAVSPPTPRPPTPPPRAPTPPPAIAEELLTPPIGGAGISPPPKAPGKRSGKK